MINSISQVNHRIRWEFRPLALLLVFTMVPTMFADEAAGQPAQAPTVSASVTPLATDPSAEAIQRAEARSYKEAGDQYFAEDRLEEAAEAYAQALSLGREAFTIGERVEMAVYISWEDRLDEAAEELQLVLSEDPDHLGARYYLATVYSWDGDLTSAIAEADRLLEMAPDDKDALRVKADALGWQGRFRQAIPLYREILATEENFDAGLGLSYALLSGGNRTEARENALRLSAATRIQEGQLQDLTSAIDALTRPRLDLRHNYYEDSDGNQSNRYSFLYGVGLGNHDFQINLTRTDSRDQIQSRRSQAASFNFSSNLTEGLSIGVGAGVNRPGTESRPHLMTGQFRMDAKVSNGAIGASVDSDVLIDTTRLIENRIRVVNYGGYASKPLSDRVSIYGAYNYKDFSDTNHAHDVQFSPEFILALTPRVTIGYQFRYLDYDRQSRAGYFDPDNYVANDFFASLYHEGEKIYTYMNVFAGKQQYTRNGFRTDDAVLGGAFSLGFTPTPHLAIEINAEGGNFAAGSVTGFTYFNLGPRVSVTF